MNYGEHIDDIRHKWGSRLFVLGHHYQSVDILRHVDAIGDSLELSRKAAQATQAERIVFCGVHFMAESAAAVCASHQRVYMPDVSAGCPMADMANLESVKVAWNNLMSFSDDWVPIVYVNSRIELKAFCGQKGGCTCTSSNAAKVLRWVYDQGKRPFFLPDQHLGTNTAHDLGIPDDQIGLYDDRVDGGGLKNTSVSDLRIVVWRGFCHVHVVFQVAHVQAVRKQWPAARIIVHPESPRDVVRLSDAHGSTSQIIDYVNRAPEGSVIVVGTERHLVERLADQWKGRKQIMALWPSGCLNMAKTTPEKLKDLLVEWPDRNWIRVDPAMVEDARKALDRMLAL